MSRERYKRADHLDALLMKGGLVWEEAKVNSEDTENVTLWVMDCDDTSALEILHGCAYAEALTAKYADKPGHCVVFYAYGDLPVAGSAVGKPDIAAFIPADVEIHTFEDLISQIVKPRWETHQYREPRPL